MQEYCKISNQILWIDSAVNQEKVGGKAKNLNILKLLGINVPTAFVLSSDFFEEISKETKLNLYIENLFARLNKSNIKEISANIKAKILSLTIPKSFVREIYSFWGAANLNNVSVRSSAVGEDGSHDAYAGMLDSFLNVDKNGLIDAVKNCWSSLYNERCLAYRLAKNLNKSSKMAAIVQEMINSDYSGVVFSKNPISLKKEFLVEYCEGLGENLVSGKVTPARVVLNSKYTTKSITNKASYDIIQNNIKDLCKCVDKIKNFYKLDIDVEFAIANGKLYILQCRPITTINNIQNLIFDKSKWEFYVKRPFCWLFETFQKKAIDNKTQRQVLGFNLSNKNYLILDGCEYYVEMEHRQSLKKFDSFYTNDSNFFENYVSRVFEIINKTKSYTKIMSSQNYKRISNVEIVKLLIDFKDKYITAIVPTFARPDDYLEEKFISKLEEEKSIDEKQKSLILNSVVYYPKGYETLAYTDAVLSILELAKTKSKGKDICNDLKEHQKKFSWMKGPLNKTLKIFTKADYLKDIEKLCENESYKIKLIDKKKKDSQSAKMVDDAINILKSKPQLLQLYNTIRDFIYLRTKLSETSDFMFYIFRTGLLKEIRNRISLKDDEIVALSIDEIIDVLLNGKDYSKIIIDRKNGYCTLKLKGKWRECFGKEAQKISFNFKALENDKIKNDTKKEICGQIATRGYIVGKVRIIKSLNDLNRVENNDIIVSSMTTPEYTSAIERAGGFITDEGGITCHAAIISREFNIPCIVGTKNATKVLKDGQVVELNALNGTIKY